MARIPGESAPLPRAEVQAPIIRAYSKRGFRFAFGGGWTVTYTLYNVPELRKLRGEDRVRFFARTFGLSLAWVRSHSYRVRKSRNLSFHPNTYTLEVEGDRD